MIFTTGIHRVARGPGSEQSRQGRSLHDVMWPPLDIVDDGLFGASEGMIDGCDELGHVDGVILRIGGLGITASHMLSTADTTSGQHARVNPWPVIATGGCVPIQ